MAKSSDIYQKTVTCASTTENYHIVIPAICHEIRIKARNKAVDVRWALTKYPPTKKDTEIAYNNELENASPYGSFKGLTTAANPTIILTNLRLITKHALWLRASVANTVIEVTYMTGL